MLLTHYSNPNQSYHSETEKMGRPLKEYDPSISSYLESGRLSISNLFVCNDKTVISASSVCDGDKHCWQNEDEKHCDQFFNIKPQPELCKTILSEGLY